MLLHTKRPKLAIRPRGDDFETPTFAYRAQIRGWLRGSTFQRPNPFFQRIDSSNETNDLLPNWNALQCFDNISKRYANHPRLSLDNSII